MSKIKILSDKVINQIAAGEVIDNPSTIVKELIENSIDAKASEIIIEFQGAGKDLISIKDNGCGIPENQIELAIMRHATSKIKSLTDLEEITTHGFRGEALAAISSVSHLEISSSINDSGQGNKYTFIGGIIAKKEAINFPKGTRISVKKLFFNTPARRKFLKSERTEITRIYTLIPKLLFIYPNIRFQINNSGVSNVYPKVENSYQRLSRFLPSDEVDKLIPISTKEGGILISGFVTDPKIAKNRRINQWLTVNNRLVNSKSIQFAVYQGYHSMLMKNMHPQYFLSIGIPSIEIDVNIHPKKLEVKFSNQNFINTIVTEAVRSSVSLNKKKSLEISIEKASPIKSINSEKSNNFEQSNDNLGYSVLNKPQKQSAVISSLSNNMLDKSINDKKGIFNNFEQLDKPLQLNPKVKNLENNLQQSLKIIQDDKLNYLNDSLQILGQFEKYIITTSENGITIFDSHATHERILYEELKHNFYQKKIESTPVLESQFMKLAPFELYVWEQYSDFWNKIGFDFRLLSGNEIAIVAIPQMMYDNLNKNLNLIEIIRSILNDLADFEKSQSIDQYYHNMFAMIACHSAIRGSEILTKLDIKLLIDKISKIDIDLYCPHGRPIVQVVSIKDLDKLFKRL